MGHGKGIGSAHDMTDEIEREREKVALLFGERERGKASV